MHDLLFVLLPHLDFSVSNLTIVTCLPAWKRNILSSWAEKQSEFDRLICGFSSFSCHLQTLLISRRNHNRSIVIIYWVNSLTAMFCRHLFLLSLLSRVFLVAARATCPGWAYYNLTFVALWNEKARPPNFDGSKFSEVVGISHNSNYSLWEPGKNASKELKDLLKKPGMSSLSSYFEA